MNRPSRAVVAVCFLLIVALAPRLRAAEVNEQLNAYLQACLEAEDFNGSVLVAKDGQTLLAKGCGLANFEHQVANAPQTKFRLGSITKQFTAMAVLILEEQGKLKLDDPVSKHFPDAPKAWEVVTIHHLLSHTAGLPNFTSLPEYTKKWMLPSPPAETLQRIVDKPLEFTPGEQFRYSNSGYVLLGAIIEHASGESYADFVRKSIFEPLAMKDTGYDTHAEVLRKRAAGYQHEGGGLINAPYLDMTQPHAAGALYSTVEDLNRWDQALTAGKLISGESMEKMFTPVKGNYAYGWSVTQRGSRKQIAHGGGINGFSTFILRVPEEKLCVVVLSNVLPSQPGRMANDLASIVLGEMYTTPKTRRVVQVDPKIYDTYVGRYQIVPQFVIAITREGDKLIAQATKQGKIEFAPASETEFFSKLVNAQMTFVKDDKGEVTHLVLHQGGRDQQAKRVKDEAAPEKKP